VHEIRGNGRRKKEFGNEKWNERGLMSARPISK